MSRLRRRKNESSRSSTPITNNNNKKQKTIDFGIDHDIDSDHEDDDDDNYEQQKKHHLDDKDDDVEEEETLDAKKVRLAREYLRKLEAGKDDDDQDDGSSSSDDDDDGSDGSDRMTEHDRIGLKLQRDRLKREGVLERDVADKVRNSLNQMRSSLPSSASASATTTTVPEMEVKEWVDKGYIRFFRGHDLTPTCVALLSNGERAISGSKDHSVIVWDVEKECRSYTLCPSWKKESTEEKEATSRTMGEVLAVACSDDGRFAAVGRRDTTVCIYDVRVNNNKKSSSSQSLLKTFTGHKGPINCLSFRTQSAQLFSGSEDRCIRHYNLNEMMYLETLYGHQFGVTGVDCHKKERPISVGRDRTARAWKIAEDTHLIFRGGAKIAPADTVRIVKDDWFLTGHEDGHLGLWMTEKKRAVVSIDQAHGALGMVGRGISAIGSLRGSDLAISGSCDGYLRLWKVTTGQTLDTRSMEPLYEIPLPGYVNGIAVGPKARFCVVAVGQEHRLGRWNRVGGAKNRFGIVRLRSKEDIAKEEDDDDAIDQEQVKEIHKESESSSDSENESDA
jgi:ribosomal RNA-processing protein 9